MITSHSWLVQEKANGDTMTFIRCWNIFHKFISNEASENQWTSATTKGAIHKKCCHMYSILKTNSFRFRPQAKNAGSWQHWAGCQVLLTGLTSQPLIFAENIKLTFGFARNFTICHPNQSSNTQINNTYINFQVLENLILPSISVFWRFKRSH